MDNKNKKLVITQRGRLTLTISVALSVILLCVLGYYFVTDAQKNKVDSEITYTYSMNHMLSEAKNDEQKSRDNLRTKIKESDKLIKDSEGKVFDGSLANLETYVANIREVPDKQKIDSNNIIDYVNSENRINGFNHSLSEKHKALEDSYNSWTKKREGLDETQKDLQKEIDEGSLSVSELEELLAQKQSQGADANDEREALLKELQRKNSQNNSSSSNSKTPVEKPVVTPSTPVEKPTQTTTKQPTAPTTPTKTTTPAVPSKTPTTAPTKPTSPATPTTTPPTVPTQPTEEPMNNEGSVFNNFNERD